ncbi:MAG: ATP-binding protein [Acidimicrobiaceae bacterium]|nr:ATP-binding protein [Acidimicrobiaceae bacterium]
MGVLPEREGRWSASFSSSTAAPNEARCWLQEILEGVEDGVDRSAASLLLTELVTNAVRYGRSPALRVDIELLDAKLVVGVTDNEPAVPTPGAPGPEDVGGRGMLLVERLSANWGVSPRASGKRVWFNLNRTMS